MPQAGQPAVVPGSPADQAGLQAGDVILEINGQTIDTNHALGGVIANFAPGDEISIKYWRSGQESTVKLKLGSTE